METCFSTITLPKLENDILKRNNIRISNSFNTEIRNQDLEKYDREYLTMKCNKYVNMIDIEARHMFNSGLK